MTGTAVALPTSSDPAQWNPEEKALVSAAGLVHTEQNGTQTPAPRPVVAAFLQHCNRTGLDPFARQIYAIARKTRGNLQWTTQVSIDGARLVAERSGRYEGQTTPEFTSDGENWTQVWLSDEPPRAARVGVYKAGFREPLYAVALWEAYAVYQDVWENGRKTDQQKLSAMWSKMGPLMLAKCAEMLALRKAFPQDLSGLYSTEEMDQAGAPLPVVAAAERPAEPVAYEAVRQPVQADIPLPTASRDWAADIAAAATVDETAALYREAETAGELGLVVGLAGDNDDGSAHTVMDLFWSRKRELQAAAAITPTMVDVPAGRTAKRQWAREARGKKSRAEVRALVQEAIAAGALVQVIEELEAIERTLPDEEASEPEGGSWPVVQIPVEKEWVENEDGSFSEAPVDGFPGGDAA